MRAMLIAVLALAAVVLVESSPDLGIQKRRPPPYVNRLPPPKSRYRRSPEPEPQGSFGAQFHKPLSGPERRPSYNLDYQHKIFENKHGSVSASAGAQKNPGTRWEPSVGITGAYRFRRSPEPEPQGSFSAQFHKPFAGLERRPSYNFGYQQKFFENKHGSVSASAGAQKNPGTRWEPSVGITGEYRFRRSPEPEPQGSFGAQFHKPLSGPERRPSYNLDYQHKIFENKHGSVSASAGAQKNPGTRWEPNVGITGEYRFRRSPEPEPQGSFGAQFHKPLSGPERRPSYNLDYQHKIFENKHGSVSASAGAQKNPGTRWEPNVGITGEYRFRRSPEPEPQGSFGAQFHKPLAGLERRPSYNFGYQQKFFENKHGSVSASAGAQKNPGTRWEPSVGVTGEYRFRRDAENELEEDLQ